MSYYIFITSDDVVWGASDSKNKAKKDALTNLKEFYDLDKKTIRGKILNATEKLYDEIIANGHNEDVWEIVWIEDKWVADVKRINPKTTLYSLSIEKEIKL